MATGNFSFDIKSIGELLKKQSALLFPQINDHISGKKPTSRICFKISMKQFLTTIKTTF